LGTLAAVVIYFSNDLWNLLQSVLNPGDVSRAKDRKVVLYLILATVPGAIAGFLLEHKAETVFRSAALIAVALIVMGVALALADWLCRGDRKILDLSVGSALGIGIAQAFALIPGVSRSGVTITVARTLGLERQEAARFSFLMSIPIIAGAGVLKAKEILHDPNKIPLAVGFFASAVAGLFAIWVLMRYVQRNRYTPFVVYRWILGAFVLINLARFQ
jgi:undecaprenyl-diphosphatase